jgi:hypothetical protein
VFQLPKLNVAGSIPVARSMQTARGAGLRGGRVAASWRRWSQRGFIGYSVACGYEAVQAGFVGIHVYPVQAAERQWHLFCRNSIEHGD